MKAILFDLDGTLIDSTEPIITGFCAAFRAHGLAYPERRDITALIGHPLDFMFEHLGAPKQKIQNFIDIYKESYFKNYLAGTTLLPGAKEAIILAKNHAKIGVVTTKTSKYSKILLEHLGVAEFFEIIIGKDDVEFPKPHPEPILKALSALNEKPQNSVMIGDTPMDAGAAKSAGAKAFGVCCGYAPKNELEKHCQKVFATALEAVEFIVNSKL